MYRTYDRANAPSQRLFALRLYFKKHNLFGCFQVAQHTSYCNHRNVDEDKTHLIIESYLFMVTNIKATMYMEMNGTIEVTAVIFHLYALPQSGSTCPLWHPITVSLSSTLEIAISFSMGLQVSEYQSASTFCLRGNNYGDIETHSVSLRISYFIQK